MGFTSKWNNLQEKGTDQELSSLRLCMSSEGWLSNVAILWAQEGHLTLFHFFFFTDLLDVCKIEAFLSTHITSVLLLLVASFYVGPPKTSGRRSPLTVDDILYIRPTSYTIILVFTFHLYYPLNLSKTFYESWHMFNHLNIFAWIQNFCFGLLTGKVPFTI